MGSLTVFLGIGRLAPWFAGLSGAYNGFVCGSLTDTKGLRAAVGQSLSHGCCWRFCDRDRVWYRTAVTLSFARAKGRNYRQLPDRARSRERPSPADIVYFKR